ncbi:MAG: hypothetical protein J7L94_15030 [Caldisericaceae bacterium]|nr:hypothetical protein [Caldisericaceae bacterium]
MMKLDNTFPVHRRNYCRGWLPSTRLTPSQEQSANRYVDFDTKPYHSILKIKTYSKKNGY